MHHRIQTQPKEFFTEEDYEYFDKIKSESQYYRQDFNDESAVLKEAVEPNKNWGNVPFTRQSHYRAPRKTRFKTKIVK